MKIRSWRLTVLVDDREGGGLPAEHGLSIWIENRRNRFLFDTGASDLFTKNAEQLGVAIPSADALVISHGHYDHTGGLGKALDLCPGAPVYLRASALKTRSRHTATRRRVRSIGMSKKNQTALLSSPGRACWVQDYKRILPGVLLTGEVPRTCGGEPGGLLFNGLAGRIRDRFEDEQAVLLENPSGNILVVGCGHPGLPNLLKRAVVVGRGMPIHTVVGGLHLGKATAATLAAALSALKHHGVRRLFPGHCTAENAEAFFKKCFSGKVCPIHTGMTIEL